MKFTQNVKAFSKLLLILLLLVATIVGAVLSYLWVLGYFINLGIRVPEKTTLSITNATFYLQNTTFFDVTFLNPSYSPSEANILQIATLTQDGRLHNVVTTHPPLHPLAKGTEDTFRCLWNWANYTGQKVRVIAFVEDGSGPTSEVTTPLVNLTITDLRFDSTISVSHFNMTVQNKGESLTYINITDIVINRINISQNLSISLPYPLEQNRSVSFMCMWDWTNYQDKDITVGVYTLQGYTVYSIRSTPKPVMLNITQVLFNVTDTTRFNVTVQNSETSPTYVNITRFTLTVENETLPDVVVVPPPNLPYLLEPGSNVTFLCSWDWTNYRQKNVTIIMYTLQGFKAQHIQITPAPIILKIINSIFNPLETTSFSFIVENSEFSTMDANITKIHVHVDGIVENITAVDPSLQGGKTVSSGTNQVFTCAWNWTEYTGKNVTIVVSTQDGYSAYSPPVFLAALTITDVLFNSLDPNHFIVTVQNPTRRNFTITTIKARITDGPALNITSMQPDLPFLLSPSTYITFMCSCDNWRGYDGKDVTITIETLEGYTTSYIYKIPS